MGRPEEAWRLREGVWESAWRRAGAAVVLREEVWPVAKFGSAARRWSELEIFLSVL